MNPAWRVGGGGGGGGRGEGRVLSHIPGKRWSIFMN